jgi:hypothetical protein
MHVCSGKRIRETDDRAVEAKNHATATLGTGEVHLVHLNGIDKSKFATDRSRHLGYQQTMRGRQQR